MNTDTIAELTVLDSVAPCHLATTLNKIREHQPCDDGWEQLLKHLGKTKADDELLSLETILESNGLDDALWALRSVEGRQGAMRLYACYCARAALPIFEKEYPKDNRPRQAIETAERFAKGKATAEELSAAWDAARDAAWDAARVAAMDAARAAAWVAAWVAVRDFAKDDFRQEFICLCRLEGVYGEVDK